MDQQAPPALVAEIISSVVRKLAAEHGERVPITAIRRALASLSHDAVTLALLDTERAGVIVLISSGESPPPDVEDWILGGTRGALCWARLAEGAQKPRP